MLHKPVLVPEILDGLALRSGMTVIDGTVGNGGHAEAILEKIGSHGRLIGLDQDAEAIRRSARYLSRFQHQITLCHASFRDLDLVLAELNLSFVDAVLLDIGVSMDQLKDPSRGFSFRSAGPLDMRMNRDRPGTAADLIAESPERELADLIWKYGEERRSRQMARWITEAKVREPLVTTDQLAQLIEKKAGRRGRIHPATRVFQALRIAVNDELAALKEGLVKSFRALAPGGRLAVITFHSLEDRIVKRFFQAEGRSDQARPVTKKPIGPSKEEIEKNFHSRSAKLRILERK